MKVTLPAAMDYTDVHSQAEYNIALEGRFEDDRNESTGWSERRRSITSKTNRAAAPFDKLSEGIVFKTYRQQDGQRVQGTQYHQIRIKSKNVPSHMLIRFILACYILFHASGVEVLTIQSVFRPQI